MKQLKYFMVGIVIILHFFYGAFAQESESEAPKCPKRVKVEVSQVEGSSFVEYKEFSAVFSSEMQDIISTVSGKITSLNVAEGNIVSQGYEIAVINNALQKEIKDAEAEITKWEKILKARQNWAVRSPRAEEVAQQKVDAAKAARDELVAAAQKYTIVSDIHGKIASLSVEKDGDVAENGLIARIINEQRKVATINVGSEDLELFAVGQQVQLSSDASGTATSAKVVGIAENKVSLSIHDPQKEIPESTGFTFSLEKKQYQNVVVINDRYIQKDDDGSFVFVSNIKNAQKRYLTLGPKTGDSYLVAEGLSIGEEIITTQLNCLEDGKKIKVMVKDATGKLVGRKAKKAALKKKETVTEEVPVTEEKEEVVDEDKAARKEKVQQAKKEKEEQRAEKKRLAEEAKAAKAAERAEAKRKKLEEKEARKAEKMKEKADKCPAYVPVITRIITAGDFSEYKSFSAQFNAETVQVASTVAGTISSIEVVEGDTVEAGAVIAVINRGMKDELSRAVNNVSKWKDTLNARRNQKPINKEATAEAEAKLDEAINYLVELKARTAEYTIKAPVAGLLKSLLIQKDEEISEGTIAAEIINNKKKVAVLPLDETNREIFSQVASIPVKVADDGSELVIGVTVTDSNRVILDIEDVNETIETPFDVEFSLVLKEYTDAVTLPEDQILTDDTGRYVYVVTKNVASKAYLQLGQTFDGKIHVTDGLKSGDEIIVAEILSAKEKTLRETFKCVKEDQKVRIMELDSEKDIYVPRGYVGVAVPAKLFSIKVGINTNNLQSKSSKLQENYTLYNEPWDVDYTYNYNSVISYNFELSRRIYFKNSKYIILGINADIFSKEIEGIIETAIPHPLQTNAHRGVTYTDDTLKINQTNIYLSALYPFFEKGFYSGRVGLMMGMSFGGIDVFENFSFSEVSPYNSVTLSNVEGSNQTFSSILFGFRLDNSFRIASSFEIVVNIGYVMTNKYEVTLQSGNLLTVNFNRVIFGIGIQASLF